MPRRPDALVFSPVGTLAVALGHGPPFQVRYTGPQQTRGEFGMDLLDAHGTVSPAVAIPTTRSSAELQAPPRVPAASTTSAPDVPVGTSLGLVLRRVEHLIGERVATGIADELDELDITPERWRVLAALAVLPGQTMTELSRAAVLPPASLTRHMDRLVARGLVLRKAAADDRRRVVAALSPTGLAAWNRVHARELQVHDELRATLGASRFGSLTSELGALLELLEES